MVPLIEINRRASEGRRILSGKMVDAKGRVPLVNRNFPLRVKQAFSHKLVPGGENKNPLSGVQRLCRLLNVLPEGPPTLKLACRIFARGNRDDRIKGLQVGNHSDD